jgi:hypothetical protein
VTNLGTHGPLDTHAEVFLPYFAAELDVGRGGRKFIMLNRRYKPLGLADYDHCVD